MAEKIGANVVQLRELARNFDDAVTKLDDASRTLSTAIARDVWRGEDSQDYRHRWHGELEPSLKRVSVSLAEAAVTLRRNADAQEATSNDLGGGSVGGGVGGAGGVFGSGKAGQTTVGLVEGSVEVEDTDQLFQRSFGEDSDSAGEDGDKGDGKDKDGGDSDGKDKDGGDSDGKDKDGGDSDGKDKDGSGHNTNSKADISGPSVSTTLAEGEFAVGHGESIAASHQAGAVGLEGSLEGHVGLTGEGSISVEDDALALNGQVAIGTTAAAAGTATLGVMSTSASGEAFAGAKAEGSANISTTGVSAEAEAFVGAKVEGEASVEAMGVTAGVEGEAWAGVGVKGEFDVGFTDGKFTVGGEIGAALGVGGSVGFNFEIDVNEMANDISNAAESVGEFFGGLW